MNIAIDINHYSVDNVYFGESIKNAIIENGKFIRIFYSNDIMTLNGIYIKIDGDLKKMSDSDAERLLLSIRIIENSILDKICIPNKIKVVKICDYLMFNVNTTPILSTNSFNSISTAPNINSNSSINNFKHNSNIGKIHNLNKMLLKISGLWETTHEYGLTFKFVEINRQ
jgi:hypothetical protein